MGLIVSLEHDGMCQGATKKRAAIRSSPSVAVLEWHQWRFRRPTDQVEGKSPKALALATACVRLWTPSLP